MRSKSQKNKLKSLTLQSSHYCILYNTDEKNFAFRIQQQRGDSDGGKPCDDWTVKEFESKTIVKKMFDKCY